MTCRHCGAHIRRRSDGQWVHQPAGAAFDDGMHEFCEITVAEPDEGGR